jgi:hypothetical protein
MVLTQKERKKYFPKRILAIIYQPVLQMRKYFLRIWILPCHFCGHRTYYIVKTSRVLAGRPAGRTDASAPLSAGAASPPPPCWHGGGRVCCS